MSAINSRILIIKTVMQLFPLIRRNGKTNPKRHHKGIPLSIPPEEIYNAGRIILLNRIEKIMIANSERLRVFATQNMMINRTRHVNERV